MIDHKKLGGSDAGALVGLDPYKTPIDIYARIVEGREFTGNAATRRGLRFEAPIKAEYAEETGAKLLGPASLEFPGRPHLRANLDDIAERDGSQRVLEVKTANFRMAHNWGDGGDAIPPHYLAQVAWYQKASGLPLADVAVLLGGCELRIYTVEADTELQEMLLEAADRFWVDHVLPKRPPPPDGSESYAEFLKHKFPRNERPLLQSTPEIDELAGMLRQAELTWEAADQHLNLCKDRMKVLLGDADGVHGSWGKLSWRCNKSGERIDWKSIAEALGPTQKLINAHTNTYPGARVFRASWTKEE